MLLLPVSAETNSLRLLLTMPRPAEPMGRMAMGATRGGGKAVSSSPINRRTKNKTNIKGNDMNNLCTLRTTDRPVCTNSS